jgi:3-hydroxyisobutyrate dehydrogenase-like beta-hydroxyacid dehydrogenase
MHGMDLIILNPDEAPHSGLVERGKVAGGVLMIKIATVAIAEALVFGKKAGLDPRKIFEVVSVSTGNALA